MQEMQSHPGKDPAKSRMSLLFVFAGIMALTTALIAAREPDPAGGTTAVHARRNDPGLHTHRLSGGKAKPAADGSHLQGLYTNWPSVWPQIMEPFKTPVILFQPTANAKGSSADLPAGFAALTNLVLDDEFNTRSLNQKLWSPNWFGNRGVLNDAPTDSANVSVDSDGLELKLSADGTGGLVSSNPDDGQRGHTGFQIAPAPSRPVYVEWQATLPTVDGRVANWPALWLTGQDWPVTGEIDVMEGHGNTEYHIEYGPKGSDFGSGVNNPGGVGGTTGGTHTYGVLWTTTRVTFVYDGVVVGSERASLKGPMYLVMVNSPGAPSSEPSTMTVRYVRVWN